MPMWVWTFDPAELVPVACVALLYLRRVHTLSRRGAAPPTWKPLAFLSGLLVAVVAVVSPIDWLGEHRSFAIHMVQHLLLGDIAPLLCVAGLSGPLLRPVLALPALARLRTLTHPLVAFPAWAIDLGAWHLPGAYQAALENNSIHAAEHACFFMFGSLLWAAILEPLPGPSWFGTGAKMFYVLGVRLYETLLAFVFVWSHTVFYPYYTHLPRLWGWKPIEDQNLAGIVMLAEGTTVTIGAFLWLFWRWFADSELESELIERGIPSGRAARAVRYRHAAHLRILPPGHGNPNGGQR
jgi:cytochrome c oxidase assembly factor CtaG